MQFDFSRKFTLFLKGIAIFFMIIHHSFGFPEWYVNDLCYPSLLKYAPYIKQVSVICVGIFAFITGYIYSLNKTKNYRYSLKKIISFLKDYWVIYTVLLCIAIIFCGYQFNIQTILNEMLAIKTPIMNFCWYVSFYICAMLILPIYTKIIKINHLTSDLLLAGLFVVVFDKLSIYSIHLYYVRKYMPILLCGYIIGKYNLYSLLFEKIKKTPKPLLIVLGYMIVFVSLAIQTFKPSFLTINISAYSVPFFIFGIYLTGIHYIKILDNIVVFLGKHSTNIWFLHCIFYSRATCNLFQKYAYLPKNPVLVVLWILMLCTGASLILTPLQKAIGKRKDVTQ